MMPHEITREFESAIAEYCGSRFAVATTSCTMAIQIALAWKVASGFISAGNTVSMPKFSYVGVCASIKNAGLSISFDDRDWSGEYEITGSGVWDSARRTTSGMFRPGAMQCLSGHWAKILSVSQMGVVIHDSEEADVWMRRYRFDGRTEGVDAKVDQVTYPSVHAYLSPEVAAHGLMKLSLLPKHNADLPRSAYPDLSELEAFK